MADVVERHMPEASARRPWMTRYRARSRRSANGRYPPRLCENFRPFGTSACRYQAFDLNHQQGGIVSPYAALALTCPNPDEMNGHTLTAWLAVLSRRIGSEAGFCQIRRDKARYLFIVLDLRARLLQQLLEV
jgi:hypothetical protein